MTSKTKTPAAEAPEAEIPVAERIDMNDPTLSDAETVARNLGIGPADEPADEGKAG